MDYNLTAKAANAERLYIHLDGQVLLTRLVSELPADKVAHDVWLHKLPGKPDRKLRVISRPMSTLFATTWVHAMTNKMVTVGFGVITMGKPMATNLMLLYDNHWWTMAVDADNLRQLLTLVTGDDRVDLAVAVWRAVYVDDVPWYAANRRAVTKLLHRALLRPLCTVTVNGVRALAWPERFAGLPAKELDPTMATGDFTLLLTPSGGEPAWVNPLDAAYALGVVHGNMHAAADPNWAVVDNYALAIDYQQNIITPWCRHRGKWVQIPFHACVYAYAECMCTVAPQVLAAHELAGRPPAHNLLLTKLRKMLTAYTGTVRRLTT